MATSDVISVNLVCVSGKIIKNSDNFRIKSLFYRKISVILCVLFSAFTLFSFNLGKHLNSFEKISLFFLYLTLVTSCIIGPFILDNLFALKLNFPYISQPSQVRIFISNWAHSRDSKSKFEATLYIQGFELWTDNQTNRDYYFIVTVPSLGNPALPRNRSQLNQIGMFTPHLKHYWSQLNQIGMFTPHLEHSHGSFKFPNKNNMIK